MEAVELSIVALRGAATGPVPTIRTLGAIVTLMLTDALEVAPIDPDPASAGAARLDATSSAARASLAALVADRPSTERLTPIYQCC